MDPEVAPCDGRASTVYGAGGFDRTTSLDDLGGRVWRMNRPSIYAAFGDKRALYRRPSATTPRQQCVAGIGTRDPGPCATG